MLENKPITLSIQSGICAQNMAADCDLKPSYIALRYKTEIILKQQLSR